MSDEAVVLRQSAIMNILIVDDEPSIREACAEVAKQSGMKAITVATAEEALEVLENSAVDIVLTDLMLQQTNGLDLLRRVHGTSPTLPVIVLTQYGTIRFGRGRDAAAGRHKPGNVSRPCPRLVR